MGVGSGAQKPAMCLKRYDQDRTKVTVTD